MLRRVFISYRRVEAAAVAQRSKSYLVRVLPDAHVFLDTASIAGGADWRAVLKNAVMQSDVVFVLMGPGWADLRTPDGLRRRLDDPEDLVRVEVATALSSGKIVIPVLLDGARLPGASQLPADLMPLRDKQGIPASSANIETALDGQMETHSLGLIRQDALMRVLTSYPRIVEWEPNLRAKKSRVVQACAFRGFEKLGGILDLTIAGNGEHFLAFTTAGLWHRSVGSSAAFRAYGRTQKIRLDAARSALFLDGEGWDITGTIEDEAEALVREVMRAFASA